MRSDEALIYETPGADQILDIRVLDTLDEKTTPVVVNDPIQAPAVEHERVSQR